MLKVGIVSNMSSKWVNLRQPLKPEIKKVLKDNFWYLLQISCFVAEYDEKLASVSIFLIIAYAVCYMINIPLYSLAFTELFSEKSVISKGIHFYLLMILSCFMLIHFAIFSRNHIINFFQTIHDGLFDYGDWGAAHLVDITKKYKKIYWVTLGTPTFCTALAGGLICFALDIDELMGAELIKGVRNGVNFDLPVQMWYPVDTSTGFNYVIAFGSQLMLALIVALMVATADVLFVSTIYHVCVQLELLQKSLDELEMRATIYMVAKNRKYEEMYELCLKENIYHHANITKCFRIIQHMWGFPIFMAFTVGAIVIGMSGVDIIFGSSRVGTILLNIVLCIGEVANMAMICFYGQLTHNLSENLHDTLYFTNWYKLPVRLVKIKRIMMERTINPLLLTGGPWDANMDTLKTVLNTSFSYFNVIAATKE